LVDVGGTLFPNSWPVRKTDGQGRVQRLHRVLPELSHAEVSALADDLLASSRDHEGVNIERSRVVRVEAGVVIGRCLSRRGLRSENEIVARIRRAMAIPLDASFQPLPGAADLLATINDLGLRCVIASNTYWRDADSYWEDFRLLGMAGHIHAIVTSVDAGHLKPHPAVFELAAKAAGVKPEHCIVIGNSQVNDVEPAIALGMRSILVHPDDPAPASSRADAVSADLWECAQALRVMLGRL
jgi:FMN phosphatase YigB (HAD superfamily)